MKLHPKAYEPYLVIPGDVGYRKLCVAALQSAQTTSLPLQAFEVGCAVGPAS